MAKAAVRRTSTRPWIKHYPDNIDWDYTFDPTPVHERVLKACDVQGQSPALDFLGAKTTFSELSHKIRALAAALQTDFGVKKGTRVALLLPNTPFYPIAYYAILLAGGIVVNCNPLYTSKELHHIIDNAGAKILFTLDLAVVFEKAEELCANGPIEHIIVGKFASALPLIKSVLFKLVKRGDIANINASTVADKVTDFNQMIAADREFKPVKIDPHKDVAVQQYTGGTTGIPKGAMLSHANIAANVDQINLWALGLFMPPSKILAVLPFFHIFAMTTCLNLPLGNGSEVVMLPRFEIKSFLDTLVRTKTNVLFAIPTLLHAVAINQKTTREQLASIEVIISGGAPLTEEIRNQFESVSDALLAEGYGLTECSPVLTCAALKVSSKPMSIGQPLPGTEIRFVDIEDPNKKVPLGERGELIARGPQIMLGYFKNPKATKEAYIDGWFRTGDVGYMDKEGYVFLVDRIKDLIICSGFNVYPRNIEEALYHHPAVDECNVIGVKDTYRGEVPVAFVKLRTNASVTVAELKKFLTEHISKIEMPKDIIFKEDLPKTLVGKLSKNELRDEYSRMKENKSEPV